MLTSIIIPVFNEVQTVAEVVARASALNLEKEIIIIDDGSTDGSGEVIREFEAKMETVKGLNLEENRGKGLAVRRGIEEARGEIVVIQDADLEYPPEQIEELVNELSGDESVVAVFGSRLLGRNPVLYPRYYWGGRFLALFVNVLCRSRLTDVTTGHKAFRRSVFDGVDLSAEGFEIEIEITVKLLKRGLRIKEIPIKYVPRTFAQGKKINWRDGIKSIITAALSSVG